MTSTIIVIDGSIGVGQSNLLNSLKVHNLFDSDNCYFYDQTFDDYEDGGEITIEQFYHNPTSNYYRFQKQVIKTLKVNFTHPECNNTGTIHFHDSHLISCLAYCRAGRNMGYISNAQYVKLKSKIRNILNHYPNQIPQYVIRLFSTTRSTLNSIRRRGRRCEVRISREYLQSIANSQLYWLEKLERSYGIKCFSVLIDEVDTDLVIIDKVWDELQSFTDKNGFPLFEREEGIFYKVVAMVLLLLLGNHQSYFSIRA